MASCATTQSPSTQKVARSKEYFSEKDYGVKASPRVVADGRPVPKGGGRFMVGDPYQVRGKTYVPKEDPNYNKNGLASWYGSAFHGRLTANGEVYDSSSLTAAHPTFPLPSYARVTNLDNGSSVIVRVNDRGPYHPGRIIDVSGKTAEMLDIKRMGTANVNVQYVGRARMDGQDTPFLMASYSRKGDRVPSFNPGGQVASGVMVASNQSFGDQLQTYGSALPQPVVPTSRMPASAAGKIGRTQQAVAAFDNSNTPPRTAPALTPMPAERPLVAAAPRPVRVAYAASIAAPSFAPPAPAARVAIAQAPAPVTSGRALKVVQPIQAARPMAAAYASEPRSREPQVIFGNMVLQDPPGQRPVR